MSISSSFRPDWFPGICRRTHGENGLKLCMLIYLDHLHIWIDYGHGLFISLLWVPFWLRETGQIWGFRTFPWGRMEGMAWHFACWCILVTSKTNEIMVTVCWFSWSWHHFDLVKRVKFVVSGHFPENAWRQWLDILHAGVAWPPSELISLCSWSLDFFKFWHDFDLAKQVSLHLTLSLEVSVYSEL